MRKNHCRNGPAKQPLPASSVPASNKMSVLCEIFSLKGLLKYG